MIQMSSIKPCAAEAIMCTESRLSSVIDSSYSGSLNRTESHTKAHKGTKKGKG